MGCVKRDKDGRWVFGAARSVGVCNTLQAELWAAQAGLQLAWEKGYKNIVLKTDSLEVYHLLSESNFECTATEYIGVCMQGDLEARLGRTSTPHI